MIKAGSLYLSLVVALVIAILCSSAIVIAGYHRMAQLQERRYEHLRQNMETGIDIVLAGNEPVQAFDLYGKEADSLVITSGKWGLYGLAIVKAFAGTDTLSRAFLTAAAPADEQALYLTDDGRPVSISGHTVLAGDIVIPQSGLKTAYVDGQYFMGTTPVKGEITYSKTALPATDEAWITGLERYFAPGMPNPGTGDTIKRSFFEPELIYDTGELKAGQWFEGHITIRSGKLLRIPATVTLNNVLVVAPAIVVEAGFEGTCQLLARDSIAIGKNARLQYPSAAVVIKGEKNSGQPIIALNEGAVLEGSAIAFERKRSLLEPLIFLKSRAKIHGETYAGFIRFNRHAEIWGKVTCNRFLFSSEQSHYANYLVDVTIDRTRRNKYYLGTPVFEPEQKNRRVMKWLD